ncbi:MAG: ATPase family protein associated with various cellular [Rhizobium sp.]|nr:ATPase family protein associated with various cellular [Rhizobium sp.]
MHTVTGRLTRYLLSRLRRQAIRDIYERAGEAGMVETAFIDRDSERGLSWRLPMTMPVALSGDPKTDRDRIARLLRTSRPLTPTADGLIIPDDDQPRSMPKYRREKEARDPCSKSRPTSSPDQTPPIERHAAAAPSSPDAASASHPDRDYVLRTLRQMVSPPRVADVAVALMLARAVGESVGAMEELLSVLRQDDPLLVVKIPIDGFEERFGKMLETGGIIAKAIPQADGFGQYSLSGSFRDVPAKTPRMVTFGGISLREKSDVFIRTALARARVFTETPIIVADESAAKLPVRITAAADLVIRLDHVDRSVLAELLHVSAGIAPKAAFAAMSRVGLDPRGLALDDLVLAIRPGRSVDRIVDILKAIGKGGAQDKEEENETQSTKPGKGKSDKKTPKLEIQFDVSQPEIGMPAPATGRTGLSDPLRVETLAGYGEAAAWALDLKADLPVWRDGDLDWPEMSTRLLLSGPPGTGKTTFARALRNTLGVPLIATSVAHWLEPGYLGDVLKTMTAAFETAKSHAPCVLFLDELDNIGSRGSSGPHSDYWNSLINRMLELLDGASRQDGVIVVAATNHPEKIDTALLRSGRLEKHVIIAPPDTDVLAGILAHHLGGDLDHVLASRPSVADFQLARDKEHPVPYANNEHPTSTSKPTIMDARFKGGQA